MDIKSIHHIEFFVGDAGLTCHFFMTQFGFSPVAEARSSARHSIALVQRAARLVISSPVDPDDDAAEYIKRHGSGVKDIAIEVADATAAFEEVVASGARPLSAPRRYQSAEGVVVHAAVRGLGEIVHSLIQREGKGANFWPERFSAIEPKEIVRPLGVLAIDHVAICVEQGQLDPAVGFYEAVFGFRHSRDEDVATEHSTMRSSVVESPDRRVRLVLMEPAEGKRRSQIADYLLHHHGAGVQHMALLVNDLITAGECLRVNGVSFLEIPRSYYEELAKHLEETPDDLDAMARLNILMDREGGGLLLQAFTKPLYSRPTFFVELVDRRGALGFGSKNIKALFMAIEAEQSRRATAAP
jgi:4-hydroxyphenylpyruvate dioxygenase